MSNINNIVESLGMEGTYPTDSFGDHRGKIHEIEESLDFILIVNSLHQILCEIPRYIGALTNTCEESDEKTGIESVSHTYSHRMNLSRLNTSINLRTKSLERKENLTKAIELFDFEQNILLENGLGGDKLSKYILEEGISKVNGDNEFQGNMDIWIFKKDYNGFPEGTGVIEIYQNNQGPKRETYKAFVVLEPFFPPKYGFYINKIIHNMLAICKIKKQKICQEHKNGQNDFIDSLVTSAIGRLIEQKNQHEKCPYNNDPFIAPALFRERDAISEQKTPEGILMEIFKAAETKTLFKYLADLTFPNYVQSMRYFNKKYSDDGTDYGQKQKLMQFIKSYFRGLTKYAKKQSPNIGDEAQTLKEELRIGYHNNFVKYKRNIIKKASSK